MGWGKFRDQVSNRIENVKRIRNCLSSSPERDAGLNAAKLAWSRSLQENPAPNVPLGDANAANNNPLNLKPGSAFVINHNTYKCSELGQRVGSSFDILFEEATRAAELITTVSKPLFEKHKNPGKSYNLSDASTSCTNAANNNPLNLKPGLAFVINHNTFECSELDQRVGSSFDIQKIEEVLQRFQISFNTVPDGTLADVKRIMAELENFNFSNYASVIPVIMSHGYENDVLAAKDGSYSLYREVLYPILRNHSLVGKPKLLFIQSCKGLTDLTLSTDSKIAHELPTKVPDDILQFNSCVEGYCSYRHKHGSIFIQILCEKIEEFGATEDIRDICNKVIDAVKWEFAAMQIPMIHTNITKPFVLGHYSA